MQMQLKVYINSLCFENRSCPSLCHVFLPYCILFSLFVAVGLETSLVLLQFFAPVFPSTAHDENNGKINTRGSEWKENSVRHGLFLWNHSEVKENTMPPPTHLSLFFDLKREEEGEKRVK